VVRSSSNTPDFDDGNDSGREGATHRLMLTRALAVYLDLARAFDTVNHPLLLEKPTPHGINCTAHDWFKCYLSNRTQQVCIGGQLSAPAPATIGVSQGSILGTLAFILFINDLPKTVKYSEVHMYADDTVVFFSSDSPDTTKD